MKRCLLVLSVLAVALSACGGALPAVTPTTVAAPTDSGPSAILGCMDPAATNFNPEATSPRNEWCIYATPTVAPPTVPVYRCTNPKWAHFDPVPTDNNGKLCSRLDEPVTVLGVDLFFTRAFTASSFQTSVFTMTAPKDETLIIVQAASQHGATTITEWPKDSVYLDFVFPNGLVANNPIPYDVQSIPNTEGPGQVEWVFGVGTDLFQQHPFMLVLPDGVVVPLAPFALKGSASNP